MADPTTAAHLAEYEALKEEQRDRIGRRDTLVRETWLASAVVVGAVVTDLGTVAALLLLPPVVLVLGWTNLRNDRMVTAIRLYLGGDLASALNPDEPQRLLRWEWHPRPGRPGRIARWVQAVADLTTFVAPALAAAAVYLAVGRHPAYLASAVVEVAAALGLAWAFLSTVDTSR